jgi:hypothetical protein
MNDYNSNWSIEKRIEYLLNTIPPVEYNGRMRSLFVGWGDEDELKRRLNAENQKVYPLCWQTPTKTKEFLNHETKNVNLVLAQLTSDTDFNTRRDERVYYPLLDVFKDRIKLCFNNSGATIIEKDTLTIDKVPNYTNTLTINTWDALIINFDLIYYKDKCLNKKINYNLD